MLNASLTGPHIKIDRAKKHVADLRADIEAFIVASLIKLSWPMNLKVAIKYIVSKFRNQSRRSGVVFLAIFFTTSAPHSIKWPANW